MEKSAIFRGFTVPEKKSEFVVYVRRDGRMTVPKEVRDALEIEEGHLVKCEIKKVKAS